ncbi:MAG: GlcG/HbpS family heme-binding protein [Leucothrix sp.]
MNVRTVTIGGLFVSLCLNPLWAEDDGTDNSVVEHRLSLATALRAAEISVISCRKQGLNVSAAVVDNSGLLQVLLRDTHAKPVTTSLSQRKAYTAANFSKDTTQLANLSDTAVGRTTGILMSAGGVLIKVDDVVYGAIGVSGSDTGAKDDECAKAGLLAISKGLSKPPEDEQASSDEAKNDQGS